MAESDLVYFDIAAVVVMLVSLGSFLVRHKTKTPANRVYLSVLILVLLTAVTGLAAEVYDKVGGATAHATSFQVYPPFFRGALQVSTTPCEALRHLPTWC